MNIQEAQPMDIRNIDTIICLSLNKLLSYFKVIKCLLLNEQLVNSIITWLP